jgi:undecaprenyl-diphosphatase
MLVPWFANWPYAQLDPSLRKSFEVALHAGTAAALLACPPAVRLRVGVSFLAPAVVPAALTGYTLGGQIERRLGTPATTVVGLIAGTTAMFLANLRNSGSRSAVDARPRDGLMVGLAQAIALMPGVSRSGATLTAARARGFSRGAADELSWTVGLPVILGAAALKGVRLTREEIPRGLGSLLAVGAGSAFLSTLISTKLFTPERRVRLLSVCTAYRGGLTLLAIRRMRDKPARQLSIQRQ